MVKKVESNQQKFDITKLCYTAYFITVAIYTLAFFSPEGRIWGVNNWAYLPDLYFYVLLGSSFFAFMLILYLDKRDIFQSYVKEQNQRKDSTALLFMLGFSVVLIALFYFLRVKTFFLGDGYEVISMLSSENPLLQKTRQFGESLLHISVFNLLGSNGEQDALSAYRIVSIAAGIFFLAVLSFFSFKIFSDSKKRILFFIGVASGGYMFLYFGYVENYSVFILSVLTYSLSAILILQGKYRSWVIIPLQIMTVFFHIFGVTLLPATIYIIFDKTKLGESVRHLSSRLKIITAVTASVILIWGFTYYYINDYFFRLSLVPIFADILTIEGYTLFSINHLVDMANLLILLVPGILVLTWAMMYIPLKGLINSDEFKVLALILAGTLGAVFIFDPKLGMARDWDLFAFSGVALSVFLYYNLLNNYDKIRQVSSIVLLASVLGFLSLVPRAVALTNDEASVLHFKNYLKIDNVKNRNSRIHLVNFYKGIGDSIAADETLRKWKYDFPEELLMKQCNRLYAQKKYSETLALLYRILEMNPVYSDAYGFLGTCYTDLKMPDSAIEHLRIAIALNPNRLNFISTLGLAYIYNGEYEKGENTSLEATVLDSTIFAPYYNLAYLYRLQNDWKKYFEFLTIASKKKDAPVRITKELIKCCVSIGNSAQVQEILYLNRSIRSDTLFMRQLKEKLPNLNYEENQ